MGNIINKKNISKLHGKIGIYGGTFNPTHIGHLECAQIAADNFSLQSVLMTPACTPNFKQGQKIVNGQIRLQILNYAIKDFGDSRLVPCSLEIDRGGISYTFETMEQLSFSVPNDCEFYFILGSDSLRDIEKWKNYDSLISLTRFICIERKGYNLTYVQKERLKRLCNSRVFFIEVEPTCVSSTEVRNMIKEKNTEVSRFLTRSELTFIYNNSLYLW